MEWKEYAAVQHVANSRRPHRRRTMKPCVLDGADRDRTGDPLLAKRSIKIAEFYKLLNLRAVLGIGVVVQGPSGALCLSETHNRAHNILPSRPLFGRHGLAGRAIGHSSYAHSCHALAMDDSRRGDGDTTGAVVEDG